MEDVLEEPVKNEDLNESQNIIEQEDDEPYNIR